MCRYEGANVGFLSVGAQHPGATLPVGAYLAPPLPALEPCLADVLQGCVALKPSARPLRA